VEPLSLSIEAVSHRHPGRTCDTPAAVSFGLAAGERALLLGPNGAGKTTLLLRVAGILSGPGVVRVDGEEMSGRRVRRLRRGIGFLWQSPDDALLLPVVVDDVALGPRNDGCDTAQAMARAREWLDRLGVTDLASRRVRELSQGEKQMVAMAGVLAREPGLLLLDEPSSALDEEHRERLATVLAGLPATVLLASHEPGTWLRRRFSRRIDLCVGPDATCTPGPAPQQSA
jgi:cobalt/nickel transport system ATP-binding protein